MGSWLRNHPRFLEAVYTFTHRLIIWMRPLFVRIGLERVDDILRPVEEVSKGLIFDCRMCGQCILHSTGMTCPMTCPKNLRNGPCGGVRLNGNCEVIPTMRCVWVEAVERSQRMPRHGNEIIYLQPPVNRQLEGDSAWVNMLGGSDKETPPGWREMSEVLEVG